MSWAPALLSMRPHVVAPWCGSLVLVAALGCEGADSAGETPTAAMRLPALAALGGGVDGAVVAQGQLEPAGGVLPVMAMVGDRVEEISVSEGDRVEVGQSLGRLQSLEVRQSELEVAQTQLEEARVNVASERRVAEANLEVARVELKKAELQLNQATERFRRAESEGGRLDLLRQRVTLAENRLEQMRQASEGPDADRLVSPASLNQQELEVRQARADWEAARHEAMEEIETGKLSIEVAKQEVEAAEVAIEAGKAAASLGSQERRIKLLELQVESAQLISPIDGQVLSVDAVPGASVTAQPLLQLADTSDMICRAEVNVADLRRIGPGSEARVSSPALPQPLRGTVRSISRMVGSPKLPSPSPMARVDWRSAEVIIGIEESDAAAASELVHLQVDVAIAATADTPPDSP